MDLNDIRTGKLKSSLRSGENLENRGEARDLKHLTNHSAQTAEDKLAATLVERLGAGQHGRQTKAADVHKLAEVRTTRL